MPRLDCVCVSVNYGDILAAVLPHNRWVFDRLVIVTTPQDKLTQKVCQHYRVECHKTEIFYKDGASFNKGAAINEALHLIWDNAHFVMLLDGDICLPPRAWEYLRKLPLDETCIYGVDRINCPSYDAWQHFLAEPSIQSFDGSVWHSPNVWPFGYRGVYGDGWLPLGFMQLFSKYAPQCQGEPLFPTTSSTAANSDLEFAMRWPRHKRVLLPEFFVYHLESEALPPERLGANWEKRTTKRFGPPGLE